jgi:hypothetical protein
MDLGSTDCEQVESDDREWGAPFACPLSTASVTP